MEKVGSFLAHCFTFLFKTSHPPSPTTLWTFSQSLGYPFELKQQVSLTNIQQHPTVKSFMESAVCQLSGRHIFHEKFQKTIRPYLSWFSWNFRKWYTFTPLWSHTDWLTKEVKLRINGGEQETNLRFHFLDSSPGSVPIGDMVSRRWRWQ